MTVKVMKVIKCIMPQVVKLLQRTIKVLISYDMTYLIILTLVINIINVVVNA